MLAVILPSDARAPVTKEVSTLLNLEFVQVVPSCQELLEAVWDPVNVIWEAELVVPRLLAAMLSVRVEVLEASLNPTSPLFQAVL